MPTANTEHGVCPYYGIGGAISILMGGMPMNRLGYLGFLGSLGFLGFLSYLPGLEESSPFLVGILGGLP